MAPPDLFDGLHFWIALRVPTRSNLVAAVRNHGGSIVALEKDADLLIADHARKDVPPGCTSWKFITESVRNGRREDQETHRIGPEQKATRPSATGTSKNTRRPFSKQDDDIIRDWVSKHETGHRGKTLFQELEAKYPHHTWQSWRDRWVKYLDQPEAPASTSAPATEPPPEAPPPEAPPVANVAPRVVERAVTQGRRAFTKEDDDILRDWVSTQTDGTRGNKIYQELEAEHPHHTWHSWRDRWVKRLAPTTARTAAAAAAPPSASSGEARQPDTAKLAERHREKNGAESVVPPRTTEVRRSPPKVVITSPGRKGDLAATGDDNISRHSEGSDEVRSGSPKAVPHARSASPPESSDANASDRSDFFERLQQFREMNGQALVTSVTVTRRPVDLWDLWRAATTQEADASLRNWEHIAETLGFDFKANPIVVKQLIKAFDLHLHPFEVAQEEFRAYVEAMTGGGASEASEDSDESGEPEEPEEPVRETVPGSSSPAFRSSPPVTGIKRGWRQAMQPDQPSAHLGLSSPRKRRCQDQDIIPASPEVHAYTDLPSASISPLQLPKAGHSEGLGKGKKPLRPSKLGRVIGSRTVESDAEDNLVPYPTRESTLSPTASQQLQFESEIANSDPIASLPEDPAKRGQDAPPPSAPKPVSFAEELENLVGLGLHPDVVIQAYKTTSLDRHLAGKVLEILLRHEPVPADQAGVWTKQDDTMLSYIDDTLLSRPQRALKPDELPRRKRMERHREKLKGKHGEGSLEKRREFLKGWVVPPGFEAINTNEAKAS